MYASRGARTARALTAALALVVGSGLVAVPLAAIADDAKPAESAKGQPKEPVAFRVMVGHLSQEPGPVDPEFESLHRILAKEFRYQSMRILAIQLMMLELQETGALQLPTGKRVWIRPMHLGQRGVLVAVDIEDAGQLDLRVPNQRPVVLGTENYNGGKLFFTLQPEY